MMNEADFYFKQNISDILSVGTKTDGDVRARWSDGEMAYTVKKFGIMNVYHLDKEFPLLTLRPTNVKAAFDELLWIWQRKSNNIADLNSHIWDSWADQSGSIGHAYGYQIAKTYVHHVDELHPGSDEKYRELKQIYPSLKAVPCGKSQVMVYLDQIDGVLYDLKNNPFSRRIMTNIYNFDDLYKMNLYPCAYSMTFDVTRENGELVLNGLLNQRSQDMIVANNWNVVQYALLIMMIAQCVDMKPGVLIHMISDAHIYDRHIPMAVEMLNRKSSDLLPKVTLNPDVKNFYEFTVGDVSVNDYEPNEQIKNIPVAI